MKFLFQDQKNTKESNEENVNEIKLLLKNLALKIITIEKSSGSITKNKENILNKIKVLSGYPFDLKRVDISIKEDDASLTLENIPIILQLSKGEIKEEIIGFIAKRNKTPIEKIKNDLKNHLKNPINLNPILPKDFDYDEDAKILATIRKELGVIKLLNSKISKIDFNNSITKDGLNPINSISTHDGSKTSYIITIDGKDFTLNLKQNQNTIKEEKNRIINSIQNYFKNKNNLNFILPKNSGSNDDKDVKILLSIKEKLINSIPSFKVYNANLINKKEDELDVTSIAVCGVPTTPYIITVNDIDFTLNLNQEKFSEEEKTKMNAIKKHLKNVINLNLELPKNLDYSDNNNILVAIKNKLI